jgi:integration host factor subunit alpha
MPRRASQVEPLVRRGLVDRLRARLGLSAREAGEILDSFLKILTEQLEKGGAASFRGLGRFETRLTPPRPGRNPATGQAVAISARHRPVFTLSPELRRRLSKEKGSG